MLWAILNKSWRQHPTKKQPYGHLPPITKTILVGRTRHAGCYCRSREELISDVLLWTLSEGQAKAGRPARIYIQQLCEDTGCSPEDPTEAMNDRKGWRERVRDIRAGVPTRWWWWWWHVSRIYPASQDSIRWYTLMVWFSFLMAYQLLPGYLMVWFSLVSLFNGISTFFRLFNAKAILLEEQ